MKKNLLRMNIQTFAEGDQDNQPKTFTEEEVNAIKEKAAKDKAAFDKTASELAELKKKQKEQLSDDEKRAALDNEIQERMNNLERENKTFKIKENLITSGLSIEVIDSITKSILDGDNDSLTKTISETFKGLEQVITAKVTAELQQSNKLPNGTGGSPEESYGAKKAKELSKKETPNFEF